MISGTIKLMAYVWSKGPTEGIQICVYIDREID